MENDDIRLGQKVIVNDRSKFYSDFNNNEWTVIGLALRPTGKIDVTIAQPNFLGWDDPTDGFSPDELRLVR